MRTLWTNTALAGAVAGLLAAAPAAAGDFDAKAAKGQDTERMGVVTDMEKDALAHRAADEDQTAEATGADESPAKPAVSQNVDQNDDGDLIATGEKTVEGDYDGSISENVDTDGDGNLIAGEENEQTAEWPEGERPVGMEPEISTDAAADTAAEGGANVGTPEERLEDTPTAD